MQSESSQSVSSGPQQHFLTARKVKIIIWAIAVILAVIVIWQNWEPVDTPILFMTVTMPRSLFIIFVMLIGFVIGLSTHSLWKPKGDGR